MAILNSFSIRADLQGLVNYTKCSESHFCSFQMGLCAREGQKYFWTGGSVSSAGVNWPNGVSQSVAQLSSFFSHTGGWVLAEVAKSGALLVELLLWKHLDIKVFLGWQCRPGENRTKSDTKKYCSQYFLSKKVFSAYLQTFFGSHPAALGTLVTINLKNI